MPDEPDASVADSTGRRAESSTGPALLGWVPKLGVFAWSFVGFVAATIIVVAALGAVSEIVLPLTFAAVLAVIFKPAVGVLERHRVKPTLAAGLVVLGLLALMTGVVVATVRGVTDQTDQIGASVDKAIDNAVDDRLGDRSGLTGRRPGGHRGGGAGDHRAASSPSWSSGVSTLIGLASGLILGALIMYYLLKDGTTLPALRRRPGRPRHPGRGRRLHRRLHAGSCATTGGAAPSCPPSWRWSSASPRLLLGLPLVFTIIVVNFIGGYIPYIGAFLGGGLAVIVALGDGGLGKAAIMLVVVLAANLLLENFVEPKVMGRTLDIHPLVVLVVTALGGLARRHRRPHPGRARLPSSPATRSAASDPEASSTRSPTAPNPPFNACSTDLVARPSAGFR